ncbi:hypothetical protein CH366_18640 [Leptospira harrisiae]|uniref:Uncharacterized protein n=1 Tax=Leptospira harrisiae TaxID=2023189 RepID=A0A2N0AFK0_9LEPT|nr:hypothetical protein CH364_18330 [Leptospira harrisiae]PKA06544.1 hypothetical protein CH366_18640 [Leptospira harrisiae]
MLGSFSQTNTSPATSVWKFFANIPFGYISPTLVNGICFNLKQTFGPIREEKIWKFLRTSCRNFFRNSGLNNNGIVVEPCPVV